MTETTQASNGRTRRLVRFGVFEADLDSGELRKQGVRVKIQGKPFQVLRALLENPGAVVTREELRRLWAASSLIYFASSEESVGNWYASNRGQKVGPRRWRR